MDISYVRVIKILYFIFSYFFCAIADDFYNGLCGNPTCSVPVGEGLTIHRYSAPDRSRISFEANERFTIFVKNAGPRKDLLGILIRDKKGYVPSNLVKEEKAYIGKKLLVPAETNFVLHDVNTNNVVNEVVLTSSWNHPDEHLVSHTGSSFQSGEQDMFQSSPQFQMSPTENNFNSIGQGASQWSNQNPEASMSYGDGNFQSGEQNYEYYSEGMGDSQSPPYHYASQYVHSSSDEAYGHYDYHSPNLEPSVHVHVQSNIVVPSHKTNVEYLTRSQGNNPDQQHYPFDFDNAHQEAQWQDTPLESSFIGQWQDNSMNSYHSPNSYSSDAHTSNFDYEMRSPTPSQASEEQTYAESQGNFKQFAGSSIQFWSPDSLENTNNQDLFDTLAMLKEQGYEISADADNVLYVQNLQANQNPSQQVDHTQDYSGADYGHSSHFQSSDEWVSKSSISAENLIPSFSSNGRDMETKETSKPLLGHKEISTLNNQNSEKTESVVNDISVDEKSDKSDFEEVDEDVQDDENEETDVEDEEETVIPIPLSENNEIESQIGTEYSDTKLPQEIKLTSTKSDTEIQESYTKDVSVSQPDIQSTPVQKSSSMSPYDYHDSSANKPEIFPSLINEKPSNEVKNIKNSISSSSDLSSSEEKNVKDVDGSESGDPSSLSKSIFVSQTANAYPESSMSQISNNSMPESIDIGENIIEMMSDEDQYTKVESKLSKTGVFSLDKTGETLGIESFNETDILSEREQETELDKMLNVSNLSESEKVDIFNPYQIRNLKEENGAIDSQNVESDEESEDNGTFVEIDFYGSIENSLEAIRSFIELLLSWVPEPLYSIIMDVQKSGISPRVPVFTIISSIPCISLIIAIVYIKEKSKEKKLTTLLALSEKNVYMLTAEKNILEEKIEKTTEELKSSSSSLDTERSTFETLKSEVESLKQYIQKTSQELESSMEEIEVLKEREKEYIELVSDHEKAHLDLREEKAQVENKILELEEIMSSLNSEIIDKDNELDELQKEKLELLQSSKDYEEKLSQLQQNCNQLLKEAEVWNMRVNELTSKLSEVSSAKDELDRSLKLKDSEIESLMHLVQTLKSYEELELTDGDEIKSNEEKLKDLLNSTNILIKLQKQEEENSTLIEKLSGEKNKILEMEVELLEAKSESDKLKINYNQALQDKAEAQTKLDVLTNYFKDKEIQMQRQIGAQEAVREKREKDADSAERRICLIEQENASYKYQVASMKQEMEETERNLKSQIATQEKKAHENWIAARAAERKLEDMKQEVTQLRQRLTLLEREQENWTNSSRDEIIRPVPKRISGINDESVASQDVNSSMDLRHNVFPPPPPLPMMLPLDRPLPPLPPPHLPPFLPPPPPLEPQFRMQPWHLAPRTDSMSGSDYRITPPDFGRGRELTPPRGRHSAVVDGDMVPRHSSPLGGEMRDSRNSTPPHSLPDFHDIPPPPGPFFPPPGAHPRYPLPPPFRRELNQGPRKMENPNDHSSSHGSQQSSALHDNWPHPNSRV